MIFVSEIITNVIVLSGIMATSGEKKSTVTVRSMGVGVGCLSPKLIRMDEASGLAAYIIYLKNIFF